MTSVIKTLRSVLIDRHQNNYEFLHLISNLSAYNTAIIPNSPI